MIPKHEDEDDDKSKKELPKYLIQDKIKWVAIPGKIILEGLSLWPERQNYISKFLNILTFISHFVIIAGQIMFVYENVSNSTAVAGAVVTISTFMHAFIKQSLLIYHRRKLENLLSTVYFKFWSSNSAGNKTENLLSRKSNFLVVYCSLYTLLAYLCCCQYIIIPLVMSGRNLPLPSKFPFEWCKSPIYEMLYIWQCFMGVTIIFTVCGFDFLFSSLVWNCIAQYKLLGTFVQEEFLEDNVNVNTCIHKDRKVSGKMPLMINCINYHNMLIKASNEIEEVFSYYLLVLFLNSVVAICISSFVLKFVPKDFGKMITYLLGHVAELFTYCYLGSELIHESTALSGAVFRSGWHLSKCLKFKKAVLMILLRSRKEQRLSVAGFTSLSLASFIAVLRLSFSFYMLLLSLMDKKVAVT